MNSDDDEKEGRSGEENALGQSRHRNALFLVKDSFMGLGAVSGARQGPLDAPVEASFFPFSPPMLADLLPAVSQAWQSQADRKKRWEPWGPWSAWTEHQCRSASLLHPEMVGTIQQAGKTTHYTPPDFCLAQTGGNRQIKR